MTAVNRSEFFRVPLVKKEHKSVVVLSIANTPLSHSEETQLIENLQFENFSFFAINNHILLKNLKEKTGSTLKANL